MQLLTFELPEMVDGTKYWAGRPTKTINFEIDKVLHHPVKVSRLGGVCIIHLSSSITEENIPYTKLKRVLKNKHNSLTPIVFITHDKKIYEFEDIYLNQNSEVIITLEKKKERECTC